MKSANTLTHQLLLIVFTILMFSCNSDKNDPTSIKKYSEYPVVADGKSYNEDQVKQILRKVGLAKISNEEKIVIQTLAKNAILISLDENLFLKNMNDQQLVELFWIPQVREAFEVMGKNYRLRPDGPIYPIDLNNINFTGANPRSPMSRIFTAYRTFLKKYG